MRLLGLLLPPSSTTSSDLATDVYTRARRRIAPRLSVLVLVVYGGLVGLTYKAFDRTPPTASFPPRTRATCWSTSSCPTPPPSEQTRRVDGAASKRSPAKSPGVSHTVAISGQSILLNANAPELRRHVRDARRVPPPSRAGSAGDADRGRVASGLEGAVGDGLINVFGAPPVDGLGTAGGFKIVIEDRGDSGFEDPPKRSPRTRFGGQRTRNELPDLFTSFRANTPWLYLDIDRSDGQARWASRMGEVFNTLQVYLGSLYVNDFNRFGRTWQVNVQADGRIPQPDRRFEAGQSSQRMQGQMVPFAGLAKLREVTGPAMITRYNLYPAARRSTAARRRA